MRTGLGLVKVAVTGLVLTVGATGCVSHQSERPLADASRYTVVVWAESGTGEDLSVAQKRQRDQVRTRMERDMVNLLRKRGGYQTQTVADRAQFKPGPDTYLLHLEIERYHAGSKAARALVGYGAGAVSLDIAYALYGEGETPVQSGKHGAGSSRDWYQCVRKVNQLVLDDVTRALRSRSQPRP